MAATADRLVLSKKKADVWRYGEDIDIYPHDGVGIRDLAEPPMFGDPDHYAGKLIELTLRGRKLFCGRLTSIIALLITHVPVL
jgi:hypothetical protein